MWSSDCWVSFLNPTYILALFITVVDFGASIQQQLYHSFPADGGGSHQRCAPITAFEVDIRSIIQ
jgi:hypothetical protein